MIRLPLTIFGVDRLIKFHIDRKMELNKPKEICGGRIILQKYYNKGAALGIFSSFPKILTAVQGAMLLAGSICYGFLWKKEGSNGLKLSLGMLLGGGLGNFYDRLVHKHVIDYVSFPAPWKWLRRLVFNLADFFIFAGAALMVLFSKD